MDWDPADVAMTNGGFAAISVALRTLLEPGDEVVFLSPPWFFYEVLILAAGGEPVRVQLEPPAFEPDVDAIEAAIGPRTRAVLINSPHNPSGRVYGESFLAALAERLGVVSARVGHPIWIISDEPYNRIVFDGRTCPVPGTAPSPHDHHLLLRQDPAGARAAHRLPDRPTDPSRARGPSRGGVPPAAGSRLGVPQRPAPALAGRPGAPLDRYRRAPATTGPAHPGAPRHGLRDDVARGHLLRDGPLAAR